MPLAPIISVNNNLPAQRAANIFADSTLRLQKSIARFSSGLRVLSAADNPGALSQFTTLDSQIGRISSAEINLNNAVSFSQTQNGFLRTAQRALDRMGELSILAQDSTKTDADRALLQQEFSRLREIVGNLGDETFNGVALFSSKSMAVTTGPNGDTVHLSSVDVKAPGSDGGLSDAAGAGISIASADAAAAALDTITGAIDNAANLRARVGSNLQQLSSNTDSLAILDQNLSAAASRIGDLDLAAESPELAALEYVVKSTAFQVGAANRLPESTLQLLA